MQMNKYSVLWKHIKESGESTLKLSFAEIQDIIGIPIDHSFLNCKKELLEYGYRVEKISMKEQVDNFQSAELYINAIELVI